MDVTFYTHYFDARRTVRYGYGMTTNFKKDFFDVVEYIMSLPAECRIRDIKCEKNPMFLSGYEYDNMLDMLFLEFKSAKMARSRRVVDTGTWNEQPDKRKTKNEGDEEITYIAIGFKTNNKAYCISQKNIDGTSFSRIIMYLNYFISVFHREIAKDNILYSLEPKYIVSRDFLNALANTRRIKAVRLIMDQTDLTASESRAFAERDDVSTDITLCYKPAKRGRSILRDTVKEFHQMYTDSNSSIKKIYVEADMNDGSPLKFDTEEMKNKYVYDIPVNISGELKYDKLLDTMRGIYYNNDWGD